MVDIECLTREEEPRTKCWKVVVPYKYREVMENDELFPEGWRHRKFYGSRNTSDQKKKQPRLEDSRVKEAGQELERERNALNLRQEDEQRAQMVQDSDLAVDISDTEVLSIRTNSESSSKSYSS